MTKQELIEFESKVVVLWERGEVKCPLHLSGGNEDNLIDIFKEVKDDDYKFSGHRNHYHALLSGTDPDGLLAEIKGEGRGTCKGNARSMAYIDVGCRFYSSAIVAGLCAAAVGVAWALTQEGSVDHVWCFVGDGALDNGHFWEALHYAEGWDLPITFVIEDNNRSTCTPTKDRMGPNQQYSYKPQVYWTAREHIASSPKVKWYTYVPSWPHVGSGTYVAF